MSLYEKLARRALRKRGWLLERDKFTEKYLRNYNLKITTLIDVGVRAGTPSLYNLFRDSQIVMIDPHPEGRKLAAAWLDDPRFKTLFLNCAAGEQEGTLRLTLDSGRSSLLQLASPRKKELATVDVEVRSLDYLVAANDLRGPFGVKIDTEGFEMSVIRGAADTLRQSAFVIAEVWMKEHFRGGYTFRQLINEMAIHGFEAVDILSFRRHSRCFDMLFLPQR